MKEKAYWAVAKMKHSHREPLDNMDISGSTAAHSARHFLAGSARPLGPIFTGF
jgi:hypothetical protein